MSEQKRNADFTLRAPQPARGIDESQPWRAPDRERAVSMWNATQEAGCDPYNNVGARAWKIHAA